MKFGISTLLFVIVSCIPLSAQDEVSVDNGLLAKKVGVILRRNCARCHKGKGSESGYAFNVMDTESLSEEGMVVPDDHQNSSVWEAMHSGRMPPRNRPQLPRPTGEDMDVIKQWINAGAPPIPAASRRPRMMLKDQLKAMRSYLQGVPREDRRNIRFFTMSHLHNDLTVDKEQLQTTRLALAKALNSLSWEAMLLKPVAIDERNTVYAVNIDKLGWGRQHWSRLTRSYPYAVSYGAVDDTDLSDIDEDIQDLRGADRTPVSVRADWMVAVGTKPPLYYTLLFDLKLPVLVARPANLRNSANPKQMTDLDLEQYLAVDTAQNIRMGKAVRCGFTESGVSGQNRLIERHSMKSGGFYWKSYDFLSANRRAILSEFPLGPEHHDNEYNDLAFEHDGGEIIFNLPNGMQGYLLIDGQGNRINAGPIEVVADSLRTSGNEQIVAGVSCIACHRNGMIEAPNDEVRQFSGAVADARDQVRKLYPEDEAFREWVSHDTQIFQRALIELTHPYLKGEDITSLPEPVGEVARRYHLESMTLETIAAELHVTPDRLRAAVNTDPRLKSMGMRILLREGGGIKRAAWESGATSMFQLTARQFGFDPR